MYHLLSGRDGREGNLELSGQVNEWGLGEEVKMGELCLSVPQGPLLSSWPQETPRRGFRMVEILEGPASRQIAEFRGYADKACSQVLQLKRICVSQRHTAGSFRPWQLVDKMAG